MSKKDKKEDLTRIEDLSEFLHPEDSEDDDLFGQDESEDDSQDDQQFPPPFDFNDNTEDDELQEEPLQETEEDTLQDFDDELDSSFSDENEPENENETEAESEDTFEFDPSNDFDSSEEDVEFSDEETDESETQNELPEEFDKDFSAQEEEPASAYLHNVDSSRENFNEIKEFASNSTYGDVQSGGNPAFSVLLKNINEKSANDNILSILKEHNLLGDNEAIYRQSLELGSLLIAQISEYSAIYLAIKLRKYSNDIQVGLSEDIHPSKSYKIENKGLTTKRSIFQNKERSYTKKEHKFSIEDMLLSKQSQISGTQLVEHLGVISVSDIYSLDELSNHVDEDRVKEINSTKIYDVLTKKLAIEAYNKGANALLSVTHSLSPLAHHGEEQNVLYQVICTGDAAIVEKLK